MRGYKKASGERVVAALVDYVVMYIVSLIISVVPLIFIGFENFFDMILGGSMFDGEFGNFIYISSVIGLLLSIIYFVYMPFKMEGQTLGKKLMKLKAVNEYGENPSFIQHFFRAIQNWTVYYTALIGWVIVINYLVFSVISMFSIVVSGVFLVSFIMMLAREDGRGLHDLLTGTYVVKTDENLNKEFAETTAQMGDWVEVEDKDDEWDKKKESNDEWDF